MKVRKIIISIILCMSIILNMSASIFADDAPDEGYTPLPPTQNEPTPIPSLKLASDSMLTFPANSQQTVEILIRNTSSFYAYNILVQAKATGENMPYKMEFLEKSNVKYALQNGTSMKVKLLLDIDKNAVAGTYPIELSYSFTSKDKTAFTGSDTIMVRIENQEKSPVVVLSEFYSAQEQISAGESVVVNAQIENIGELDARDVKIALSGLTADGVSLSGGSNTVYFKEYDSGFKNPISFNLVSHKDMKTGSYPITFKLSYTDTKGTEYTKDYEYYINISDGKADDKEKAEIIVTNVTSPNGTFGVNQVFNVKLNIKNAGDYEAKNIKVTANTGEDNAVVPRSSNIVQIRNLAIDEAKELSFDFSPTSSSKTKNYSIGFTVEYETGVENDDKTLQKETFSQYVGVNVSNPDNDDDKDDDKDKKVTVPKIIISKYQSNPIIVEAGKKFDLAMTFKNTHSTKSIHNIKMFISVEDETEEKGNVFSPDDGSNTFYIDSIPPKGETSHTFKMFTVPDAKPRTYTINANFEYEDAEANPYTSKELIGINVKQSSRLETSEITIPTDTMVGEPVNVMFQLYNMGKVTLSNLMVKIQGEDFDTSNATVFIGNFESGNSEYYEGSFFAMQPGKFDGKVIISYEDTDGQYKEKVQDFTINVAEPAPMDMEGMGMEMENMPQEPQGLKDKVINLLKNKYTIIGICAGVIIIIAAIIILKKIKKKKEMYFNE